MDSKQIDAAMRTKTPVACDGRQYRRILEYVSWYDSNGQRRLSAVLLDKNGNCTVRAPAERVELPGEENVPDGIERPKIDGGVT